MSYEFNMVDMGGIDLATANRTIVDGLYNKLLEGIDACGNLILYNWKFAEIEIAPSSCTTLKESSSIVINGLIEVTEQDEVTVLGIAPPPVPVEPLVVTANGVYTAQSPVSGFNPVSVNVPTPAPRIIPIVIEANGVYTPPPGVDGFDRVTVNVSAASDTDILNDGPIDYTASGSASGNYPINAILSKGGYWLAPGPSTYWWQVEFGLQQVIKEVDFSPYFLVGGAPARTSSAIIMASNDNSTWVNLVATGELPAEDEILSFSIPNPASYKYYRIQCENPAGTSTWPGLTKLKMIKGE